MPKELFGFDALVLHWLQSCPAGPEQFVAVDNQLSSTFKLFAGVPQEQVHEALLFVIFTTHVGKLNNSYGISYHQFADDTQLYNAIKSRRDL